MAVTYKKLFHLLIDRGVDDILEFIPDEKENGNND